MKITKQQLKELIKEELETVLNEKWDPKQAKELTMKARERAAAQAPEEFVGDREGRSGMFDPAAIAAAQSFDAPRTQSEKYGIPAPDPASRSTMQAGTDAQKKETDFFAYKVPKPLAKGVAPEEGGMEPNIAQVDPALTNVGSPVQQNRTTTIDGETITRPHYGYDYSLTPAARASKKPVPQVWPSEQPGTVLARGDNPTGYGDYYRIAVDQPVDVGAAMASGPAGSKAFDQMVAQATKRARGAEPDERGGLAASQPQDVRVMGAHGVNLADLQPGDQVPQGMRIADLGREGRAGGVHMHGEVKPGEHSEETRMGAAYRGEEEELAARARDIEDPERRADIISRAAGAPEEPPAVASPARPRIRPDATVGDVIAAADAQKARAAATPSYKVKKGDTLSRIAKRQGTSVKDIMAANPNITDPNKIARGAKLNIPAGKRDDDEGIPKPGQNLAEAWGFNMDLSKLNE